MFQRFPPHAFVTSATQSSAPTHPAALAAFFSMYGTTPHPQQLPDDLCMSAAHPPREVDYIVTTSALHPRAPSAAAASMLAINSDPAVQAAVDSLPAGTHNPCLMHLWELLTSHPTPLTTRAELIETLALLHTDLLCYERGDIVLLLNGGANKRPFFPCWMTFGGPESGGVAVVEGRRQLLKLRGEWTNRFHTPMEEYKAVKLMRAAPYTGSQVGVWIRLRVLCYV
jgi:hypothetical protein